MKEPNFKPVRKWIMALRSGEYTQGKGFLCVLDNGNPTYCCLGVLADAVVPGSWGDPVELRDPLKEEKGAKVTARSFSADRRGSWVFFLDIEDWERYGLSHLVSQTHLSEMNDQGRSFEEIADYIENAIGRGREDGDGNV